MYANACKDLDVYSALFGDEVITLPVHVVANLMDRSVFDDVDRIRAVV